MKCYSRWWMSLVLGAVLVVLPGSTLAATATDLTATPASTSVTIQWKTDIASSSQVLYGTTSSYGNQTTEIDTTTRVTSHSVTVTGLTPCTTYHFQGKSVALSYAETIITTSDIEVATTGCSTSSPATTATATPVPLAETGDAPVLYILFLAALATVGYSVQRIRQAR